MALLPIAAASTLDEPLHDPCHLLRIGIALTLVLLPFQLRPSPMTWARIASWLRALPKSQCGAWRRPRSTPHPSPNGGMLFPSRP